MPRQKLEETVESINTCLNCILIDCFSDTMLCPLRIEKVQKKRERARKQYQQKKRLKAVTVETK